MKSFYLFGLVSLFSISLNMAHAYDRVQCEDTVTTFDKFLKVDANIDSPKFLKDATITVVTKDGKHFVMDANHYKVVPRRQQFVIKSQQVHTQTVCNITNKDNEMRKNRISLSGGQGPQEGLDTRVNGNTVEVSSRVGFVGGVQYQRVVYDRFSLGVQGQTNKTGSILLGLDF